MLKPVLRLLTSSLIVGVVLSIISCSDAKRTYPVSGTVLFRGKPAEGAVVTLVPLSEKEAKGIRPSAVVRPDGTFRLSTHGTFDGAPTGSYFVTIIYLSPETKVDDQNAGPDLLQGKYGDVGSTSLRAEITPGNNELKPFLLK